MANKKGLAVLLGVATLVAPALVCAQSGQPAGLNGADAPVVTPAADQPAAPPAADPPPPAENTPPAATTAPQEQETLNISAPRYHRIHEARFPGSPNRGNPMRQFPGELPEKNAFSVPWNMEGIVVEDARQSQALPTIQGRPATPDTLNP